MGYSVDDILAELEAKKGDSKLASKKPVDIDDVLEQVTAAKKSHSQSEGENKPLDDTAEKPKPKLDADAIIRQKKAAECTQTFADANGELFNILTGKQQEQTEAEENPEDSKSRQEVIVEAVPVETEEEKQKREELEAKSRALLLEKERQNDDPNDMLDLVNPVEIKEQAINEAKKSEEDTPKRDELHDIVSGNTNELGAEIKKSDALDFDDDVDDEGVKAYVAKSHTQSMLLEKINQSIAQRRKDTINAHRTITMSEGSTKEPLGPINSEYAKKILPPTDTLPTENPVIAKEKAEAVAAISKKPRLKDFVLGDMDEDTADESEAEEFEEFDSMDASGQIWSDLCASHTGLKIRIGILSVITVISFLISFFNDFDLFYKLDLVETFSAVSVRGDVAALIYISLVLGILGFAVCSTVLSNGLSKLISLRPDCDTVCALSASIALIGGVVNLIDMQSFKLMHSSIFISTALVSLLFNTAGKLLMISRTKRNFKNMLSENAKYYTQMLTRDESTSRITRCISGVAPFIATMRKTEFLTDFLKSSYCDDEADRLSGKFLITAAAASILTGILVFLNPLGCQFTVDVGGAENPFFFALSCAIGVFSVACPFSMLFMINQPLNVASKKLNEVGAGVLGYDAAVNFSNTTAVLVDAKTLFPPGTIGMANIKQRIPKKSIHRVSIDEAILIAASIAIQSDSAMSYLFYDVTMGDKELLRKVDNCIYEDNCGITGWIKSDRVMLGGRQLMEMHDIEVPDHKGDEEILKLADPVYLSIGGEIVAIFYIRTLANPDVKAYLKILQDNDIRVIVKATDSIITEDKLIKLFDLDPEYITVLPHEAHEQYTDCTKYTSRGSGEVFSNGTFSSFVRSVLAAKNLAGAFIFGRNFTIVAGIVGILLTMIMAIARQPEFITPTIITLYNTITTVVLTIIQRMKKY